MPGFNALFERHIGSAFARQLALADLLADRSWALDVRAGRAQFGSDLAFGVQILGTESFGDKSWLWAWANDASNLPSHVLEDALRLRQLGDTTDSEFLTARTIRLETVSAHEIALAASGLAGGSPYYHGPYDGGAVYFLLKDLPSAVVGPCRSERICTVVTEVISRFNVDHKAAVRFFLEDQGFAIHENDTEWAAECKDGRRVSLRFDGLGRIKSITAEVAPITT